MSRKKAVPTKHKSMVGDIVKFKHAGSWRTGKVIELTTQSDGHATYTVSTSANGRIYPCLGLNGSKVEGYIHVEN